MIPYGRHHISPEDCRAVLDVLRSDWLTQGPATPRFEAALASFTGAGHAVAVNSATSALHAACAALGLGPGDLAWTSPISFVASANCARYLGADVDFVDIDPATGNMSVAALRAKLDRAARRGRLPKLVIPVHFAGQSCDMDAIADLAREFGFRVLEDASHAVGASFKGERVACCRYGDIAVFSFHPVKIVTSGEGGAALTNDEDLAERMRLFRSHGITRDPARMAGERSRPEQSHSGDGPKEGPKDGPDKDRDEAWYYQQTDLGFNYRLSDLHAALGLSQLSRVESCVRRRGALAARYDTLLAALPLLLPVNPPDRRSALHLYTVRLDSARTDKDRGDVFRFLRARGIGVNVHYIPIHLQPYYRRLGFRAGDFPEAEAWYARTLTLPLFPELTEEEQDRVVGALREILGDSREEGRQAHV